MSKYNMKSIWLSPFLYLGIIIIFDNLFIKTFWSLIQWQPGSLSTFYEAYLAYQLPWLILPIILSIAGLFAIKSPVSQILVVVALFVRPITILFYPNNSDDRNMIEVIQNAFGIYGESNGFPFWLSSGFDQHILKQNISNLLALVELALFALCVLVAIINMSHKPQVNSPVNS